MSMRSITLAAFALSIFSFGAQAATIVFGNNEGGLIPTPPDLRNPEVRRDIGETALAHCAWYNRTAYITGVVPGYGNYISFSCRFPPGYDPVKGGQSFWSH